MVSAPPTTGRPKIFVVEDEEDLRRMLSKILGTVGDVTTAVDGQDAYTRLTGGFVPDVIVTDLMMPRMDGLTLATKLKADPVLGRVPVVMLTAKTQARDVIAGINAGARHYVTKPFKTEELVGKVRKALAARGK
ncbi:response regulator [Sandaracinus amylolyticus]|uniref:Putative two component system response regulator n=1 Tax=Sandaracinus amylolyticus TaxID=927083 RepID=A0A0F6YLX0_9BACT|nr:response regulator [Sandaracinus amylolyticus]AKF10397.1 putative two component system response regulator [Sandaracinus amylolyticus]